MVKKIQLTRLTVINLVVASLLLGIFLSPIVLSYWRDPGTTNLRGNASPLSASSQQAAIALQNSYINVYKKASPSVVYIKTNTVVPRGLMIEYYRQVQGAGSGFIIDGDGYIVTNSHVVANARKIEVIFHDNTTAQAKLVGRNPSSDVALIKVPKTKNLVPAVLGDSNKVEPGQLAFALGAPFGLNRTFTIGTISAKKRQVDTSSFSRLQTDASINPGNSGGPLLNILGEVIGINQSIISPGGRRTAGSVGIGFAIPINEARREIETLKKERRVLGRPTLGVQIAVPREALREQLEVGDVPGLVVLYVVPDSGAENAGIKERDFIMKANDRVLKTPNDLIRAVQKAGIGGKLKLEVMRKGRKRIITARVGEDKPLRRRSGLGGGSRRGFFED